MKKIIVLGMVLLGLTGCLREKEQYTSKREETKQQVKSTEEKTKTETPDQKNKQGQAEGTLKRKVKADALNLRKEPNTNSEILIKIPNAEEVEVVDTLKIGDVTWAKIKFNNQEGYVDANFLE